MNRYLAPAILLLALSGTLEAGYAVTLPDNLAQYSSGSNQTYGYTFTVNQNESVTSLGFYENSGTGLVNSHSVGIFDGSGNLLVSTSVPSGNAAPTGGFVYLAVTPTLLAAGQTYAIGATYVAGDADPYVRGYSAAVFDPSVTFGNAVAGSGVGLVDPTSNISYTGVGVFGPSFGFNAVPEPSAYVLMGVGLAGLAGLRIVRRRLAA